jgi:hypothetical protein
VLEERDHLLGCAEHQVVAQGLGESGVAAPAGVASISSPARPLLHCE